MLKQIATSIAKLSHKDIKSIDDIQSKDVKKFYLDAAKAALQALLNPPEIYSNGVMQASLDCVPINRCEQQALQVWNNTINYMLSE